MFVEISLLSLPLWFQLYKRNRSSAAAVSVRSDVFVGYLVGA
jgi:hypothetical protein